MTGTGEARPTPALMPRRRAAIPPAQPPPRTSRFQADASAPRCGWQQAIVWPDTGVLLSVGTSDDLLGRFHERYKDRIRIAMMVVRELRRFSRMQLKPEADAGQRGRKASAIRVVNLFHDGGTVPIVEAKEQDLGEVALVIEQLKALTDDNAKGHGGEAQIIVLAQQAASEDGARHILLTNDGGASVVADNHGIPARHVGDLLAEFSCADASLSAADLTAFFNDAMSVSKPPASSLPKVPDGLVCMRGDSGCGACDAKLA